MVTGGDQNREEGARTIAENVDACKQANRETVDAFNHLIWTRQEPTAESLRVYAEKLKRSSSLSISFRTEETRLPSSDFVRLYFADIVEIRPEITDDELLNSFRHYFANADETLDSAEALLVILNAHSNGQFIEVSEDERVQLVEGAVRPFALYEAARELAIQITLKNHNALSVEVSDVITYEASIELLPEQASTMLVGNHILEMDNNPQQTARDMLLQMRNCQKVIQFIYQLAGVQE